MSDHTENPARPVSLFTIAFLLVLFGAFLFFVRKAYAPAEIAPQNAAAEKLPDDQKWRATQESRRAALEQARAEEAKMAARYTWADEKKTLVRIPVDEAIKQAAKDYGAKK